MTRRTPIDPTQIGRPIAFRELECAGISRSRIRASDVSHPFRGVHVVGAAPAELRERCEALLPLLRPVDAYSHTTALRLLGAPLPHPDDARLHVTTVGGGDRMVRVGVAGHRVAHVPLISLGTLPIVNAAHAWMQAATMLGHDDLVAIGDYLVTPNRHLRTPAIASVVDLDSAITRRARGAGRARRALSDVRIGAESRMETLTRLLLVRAGLPEPELNPRLMIAGRPLHPDLFYREWDLVLEYEGDTHRTDPAAWRRDIWRREAFQEDGYRVIQVHAGDVFGEREQFLARVCRTIAQRQRR